MCESLDLRIADMTEDASVEKPLYFRPACLRFETVEIPRAELS
jgi:hypothetical protein